MKEITKLRVEKKGAVFLTAVLDYFIEELVEITGKNAKDLKEDMIKTPNIENAIQEDDEVKEVLGDYMVKQFSSWTPGREAKYIKQKERELNAKVVHKILSPVKKKKDNKENTEKRNETKKEEYYD